MDLPLMTIGQIGGKYKKKKVIYSRADRNAKKELEKHFRGKFDRRPPQPAGSRYLPHEKHHHFASDRFPKTGLLRIHPSEDADSPSSPFSPIRTADHLSVYSLNSGRHMSPPPMSLSDLNMQNISMSRNANMTLGRLSVQASPIHQRKIGLSRTDLSPIKTRPKAKKTKKQTDDQTESADHQNEDVSPIAQVPL